MTAPNIATTSVTEQSAQIFNKTDNEFGDPLNTKPLRSKDFGALPIPRRLRHDPDKPFHFGVVLNIAFGIASTFTVANLYYVQPLLIQFSESFNVSYNQVSIIPTLIQAGYACGLLFITPLGDLLRRRQLLLSLITLSMTFSIGLAVTNKLRAFEALSFLIGMVSVTPQVLLPLAADLAPPESRASAISVVLSGLLLGVLAARVLAGIIAEFTTWRVVYYLAIGTQAFILFGSYWMIPDYPSKNKHMTYLQILWSMVKFAFTEPLLIQASLISLANAACFANFWVTLTFLLGGPPYHYSTLVIGLFGFVGMAGVAMSPVLGRLIDKLNPWHATLVALVGGTISQSIQVGGGGINVAAVVIATIGIDVFRQMLQVSLSAAVFAIDASARARLNAVLILSFFIGQVIGTPVGTTVFVRYGWRPGAALNLGWYGLQFVFLFLRGPHCQRRTWFGYEGGIAATIKAPDAQEGTQTVSATPMEKRSSENEVKNGVETITVTPVEKRSSEIESEKRLSGVDAV